MSKVLSNGAVQTGLFLVGLAGYQLLWHRVVEIDPMGWTGTILFAVPLMVFGLWLAARSKRPVLAAGVVAGLTVIGVAIWRLGSTQIYWMPHVLGYLALLWIFGRTLRPGSISLVTRIARLVHGTLPPEIERYTRQVTWAWCVFFALMATVSVALFAFAPLATWSLFANVLNVPLVVLMFVAEYVYRLVRYPDFPHVSLIRTIQAVAQLFSSASKAAGAR